MVDVSKGIGNIQNIQQTTKSPGTSSNREKQVESARDSVEVSGDAQILSSLPETREQVARSDQPLGLEPGFVKQETES